MEKNVTGIDLEELRAAREAMLQESGSMLPPTSEEKKEKPKDIDEPKPSEMPQKVDSDENLSGQSDFEKDLDKLLSELEDVDNMPTDNVGYGDMPEKTQEDLNKTEVSQESPYEKNIDNILSGLEGVNQDERLNPADEIEQTNSDADDYDYSKDFPVDESLADDEQLLELINDFISTDADFDEGSLSNQNNNVAQIPPSSGLDQKRNLSHYDAFSQFEINSAKEDSLQTGGLNQNAASDGLISLEAANSGTSFEETIARQKYQEPKAESKQEEQETRTFVEVLKANDTDVDGARSFDFDSFGYEEKEAHEDEKQAEPLVLQENLEESKETQASIEPKESLISEEKVVEPAIHQESTEIEKEDESLLTKKEDMAATFVEEEMFEESNVQTQEEIVEIDISDEPEEPISQEVVSENAANDEFNEILLKKSEELKTRINKVEIEQKKIELLPEIEPINFVNVLSMQDFKNSDNFTFVLGRSDKGNIIYENLKQCYNIAFFANSQSYEMLNTMLLSFMLKNSAGDFKFALCDGGNAGNFNFYNQSKYLFEEVAKTDDDISLLLSKVISELEDRYHTLAKFNVRSIDEYNILAKNAKTPKLAQLLVVVDGYSELMHSENFEKIKSSLYQILRLGRIAGIFVVVVTNKKIEEDIINFNLPSRIGFRCSEHDDSVAMIGEMGLEKLANKHEYLYSSVHSETTRHIRQPGISGSIIKILIDNIEN